MSDVSSLMQEQEAALKQAAQWFRENEKHYMRTGGLMEAMVNSQRAIVCETALHRSTTLRAILEMEIAKQDNRSRMKAKLDALRKDAEAVWSRK